MKTCSNEATAMMFGELFESETFNVNDDSLTLRTKAGVEVQSAEIDDDGVWHVVATVTTPIDDEWTDEVQYHIDIERDTADILKDVVDVDGFVMDYLRMVYVERCEPEVAKELSFGFNKTVPSDEISGTPVLGQFTVRGKVIDLNELCSEDIINLVDDSSSTAAKHAVDVYKYVLDIPKLMQRIMYRHELEDVDYISIPNEIFTPLAMDTIDTGHVDPCPAASPIYTR